MMKFLKQTLMAATFAVMSVAGFGFVDSAMNDANALYDGDGTLVAIILFIDSNGEIVAYAL